MNNTIPLDEEETQILNEIDGNEWKDNPLSQDEARMYKQYAEYTLSLRERKPTPIDFTVAELAFLKAKSREIDVNFQIIVQALVRNYAAGKIRLEL